MKKFLIIDGGGTKADVVIFSEDGHIIDRSIQPGGNLCDIGYEKALAHYSAMIKNAVERAGGVTGIYCGVAGAIYFDKNFFPKDVIDSFGAEYFKLEADVMEIISTKIAPPTVAGGLVCGTGCGYWVRNPEFEKPVRLGGWSYIIDTLGSGFILGRDAYRAYCWASEGREEHTLLCDLVAKDVDGRHPLDVTPEVVSGGRVRIAKFAHCIFDAAKENDPVALRLMHQNAKDVAGLIVTGDKYFSEPYSYVAAGGIVQHYPEYAKLIAEYAPKRSTMILSDVPPIYGCAVEAMILCGVEMKDDFEKNFTEDLKKFNK